MIIEYWCLVWYNFDHKRKDMIDMSEEININIPVLPESIDKALENITEKPSKEIGNTFADIWYLVCGGLIGNSVEKRKLKYAKDLEKYKQKIEKSITKIPQERRSEPEIRVVGTALEASKYCIDKALLREMFANLIASSMDKDKEGESFLDFVEILRYMPPNIAEKVIYLNKYMKIYNNRFALVDVYRKTSNIFSDMEFAKGTDEIFDKFDDMQYEIVCRNVSVLKETEYSFLLRHGIIDVVQKYSPMVNYDIIYEVKLPQILEDNELELEDTKIVSKYYYITAYGKKFLEVVL